MLFPTFDPGPAGGRPVPSLYPFPHQFNVWEARETIFDSNSVCLLSDFLLVCFVGLIIFVLVVYFVKKYQKS